MMTETSVSSSLNPNANSFIPSRAISNKKDWENAAKKLINECLRQKLHLEEKVFSKMEIIEVIEKLIKVCSGEHKLKAQMLYKSLSRKLPDFIQFEENESNNDCVTVKQFNFDLSVYRPPRPSLFLSQIFGLYRHEPAVRPLISLTNRPDNLKDKVWSLTTQDLKLWNSSCYERCECPPMFGYSIPQSFFGNPLNLKSQCPNPNVHLNRYPEQSEGNELVLFDNWHCYPMDVEPFNDDYEDKIKVELNIDFYSEQLKIIVSGVCDLISDKVQYVDSFTSLTDDYKENLNFKMFWDAEPYEEDKGDYILEDDDCHPLLESDYTNVDKGVTEQANEVIQSISFKSEVDNDDIKCIICDPPCSYWCHDGPKLERSDSVISSNSMSDAINLLNETTEFLLNSSTESIFLNGTVSEPNSPTSSKPCFKRSFSANDCDPSYDARFRQYIQIPKFLTSREDLAYLRRDPLDFFRTLQQRNESWRDTDSGICCHWPSQDDDSDYSDRDGLYRNMDQSAPMWHLFNAEDSLWKPLPDCAPQEHMKLPHKRVWDLRRQQSCN